MSLPFSLKEQRPCGSIEMAMAAFGSLKNSLNRGFERMPSSRSAFIRLQVSTAQPFLERR